MQTLPDATNSGRVLKTSCAKLGQKCLHPGHLLNLPQAPPLFPEGPKYAPYAPAQPYEGQRVVGSLFRGPPSLCLFHYLAGYTTNTIYFTKLA